MESLKNIVLLQRVLAFEATDCHQISGSTYYLKTWNLYCALVSTHDFHCLDPYLVPLPRGIYPAGPSGASCTGPHTSFAFGGMVELSRLRDLDSHGVLHLEQLHFIQSWFDEATNCLQIPIGDGGAVPRGEGPCAPPPWVGRPPRMAAKVSVSDTVLWTGSVSIPVATHLWTDLKSPDPDGDPAITAWDPRAPDAGYPTPEGDCGTPWSRSSLDLGGAIRVLFVDGRYWKPLREYLVSDK